MSIRDFHRLTDIVEIGRRATRDALPRLRAALSSPSAVPARSPRDLTLHIDPVCRMIVSPARARARVELDGVTYYFCSVNCCECFERYGDRYRHVRTQHAIRTRPPARSDGVEEWE